MRRRDRGKAHWLATKCWHTEQIPRMKKTVAE
jgi:hypothetical protein